MGGICAWGAVSAALLAIATSYTPSDDMPSPITQQNPQRQPQRQETLNLQHQPLRQAHQIQINPQQHPQPQRQDTPTLPHQPLLTQLTPQHKPRREPTITQQSLELNNNVNEKPTQMSKGKDFQSVSSIYFRPDTPYPNILPTGQISNPANLKETKQKAKRTLSKFIRKQTQARSSSEFVLSQINSADAPQSEIASEALSLATNTSEPLSGTTHTSSNMVFLRTSSLSTLSVHSSNSLEVSISSKETNQTVDESVRTKKSCSGRTTIHTYH